MISRFPTTMSEAARLTRAGRLDEAMALLRGGAAPAANPNDPLSIEGPAPVDPTHHAMHPLRARFESFVKNAAAGGRSGSTMHGALPDVPPGARFEEEEFISGAGRRRYKLFRPHRDAGDGMPLVVMLHGCQQSPDDFAAGTQMNRLAEEMGFFVVYPEQTSAANPSRCWNWFSPADQGRDAGEPALIAGITREVMRQVAVDPSRVYIAGLSAGGASAAIMGAAYPDLFAAVCVHSGLACGAARDMSSAFAAMQGGGTAIGVAVAPLPTIVFHGDRDHTVNPVNGDQVIAQSKGRVAYEGSISAGRSAGGIAYTRTVHAGAEGRPALEQWVLHGLGHAWSGGSSAGSFTDPRGPDASREMMRFFLAQAKPAQ